MLEVKGRVSLDGNPYEAGLRKIEGATGRFVGFLGGLKAKLGAAFSTAAVVALSKSTLKFAGDLVDTSKRLDTTIEQLQVMRQAAKDNSTEFDAVADAMEKINVLRQQALSGGEDGAKAMAKAMKLGMTEEMMRSQTAANLLTGPVARTVQTNPVADISKDLKDVFGKGFGDLIPFLKEDFEAVSEKLRKLGMIMDGKTAVQLDYLGDNLTMVSQILVTQAAPAILSFSDFVLMAIGKIKGAMTFWDKLRTELAERFPGSGVENISEARLMGLHAMFNSLDDDAVNRISNIKDADPERANMPEMMFSHPDVLAKWAEAVAAAADAGIQATTSWEEMIEGMKKRLADEAAKLGKPAAPSFEFEQEDVKKSKSVKEPEIQTDALMKVGNFLGTTGQQGIVAIQREQVGLLKQIAKNTSWNSRIDTSGESLSSSMA